jgi:hypothetical protein
MLMIVDAERVRIEGGRVRVEAGKVTLTAERVMSGVAMAVSVSVKENEKSSVTHKVTARRVAVSVTVKIEVIGGKHGEELEEVVVGEEDIEFMLELEVLVVVTPVAVRQ